MKRKLILGIVGKFMIIESVLMLLSSLVSLIYKEHAVLNSFIISALISALLGISLSMLKPKNTELYAKEGLVIIGLVWVIWSAIGAMPFFISGEIPRYIDAFFETVSGFTTTGATILTDIEAMSKGLLFWRSFTHWVGGMGVLIFAMALVSVSDKNALHLMRAEVPGPAVSKLVPRGTRNAKILYGMYIALCVIEFTMLVLGGMPVYDSIIHTFSTAGTGGFSCKNASIAAYNSAYIDWVIIAFMFLFSINFNLYYFTIIKRFSAVWNNSEWKIFTLVVLSCVALLTLNLMGTYQSIADAIRHSTFITVATISTTGFGLVDYNLWSSFAKTIIIGLMIIGACAGSTGGGLKISRIIIMAKNAVKSVKLVIRPNSVSNIRVDGKPVEDSVVRSVINFFVIYFAIIFVSVIIISLDVLNIEEIITSVITCVNNVGPALGVVGPAGNYSSLSDISKLVLSLDMLLGRLDIFPILILFIPSIWKKNII